MSDNAMADAFMAIFGFRREREITPEESAELLKELEDKHADEDISDLTTLPRDELVRRLEAVRIYCGRETYRLGQWGVTEITSEHARSLRKILELTEGGQ